MSKKRTPPIAATTDGDAAGSTEDRGDVNDLALLEYVEKNTRPDSADADPTAESATARGGRPKGAKAQPRPEVVVVPAQCPNCKSSRRAAYRDGPAHQESYPVEIDGRNYNRQTWRNTQCVDCGQHYRTVEHSFVPDAQPGETAHG